MSNNMDKSRGSKKRRNTIKYRGKTQRHGRTSSQQGRDRTIGNSKQVACSHCRATLSIRLHKKKYMEKEMLQYKKNKIDIL